MPSLLPASGVFLVCGMMLSASVAQSPPREPHVQAASWVGRSPPISEVARRAPAARRSVQGVRELPRYNLPRDRSGRKPSRSYPMDPVAQRQPSRLAMPPPLMTFEGVGNLDGVLPPDNCGDVGFDHYVEMVNLHFGIFDKATGAPLISPMLMSELFAAAGFPGPAATTDDGDPIALFDHLANRWLISQFLVSVTPPHQVIAISQTPDPTGAWHLYDFVMPNTKMNDYPKLGVWPDGYYMTDNQFAGFNWGGAGVFVFDRTRMLTGDVNATYQYFDLFGVSPDFGGMLPSDLDGPPPPAGTPNYFLMVDDSIVNPFDAMYIWEFRVNWTNPALTTFGADGFPNYTNAVADFDSSFAGGRNNIPQPGTPQKLDALADRLLHRVQYRYFGGYDSLVASHTVDENGSNHAGVRYYQFRRSLPGGDFGIHEQATFAPDTHHRWMGSAALDGQGNLAIGYSVSSTSVFPSIRYAGRLASDPPGGLFQGEGALYAGSGSQTHTAARWGDYTMLSVDPLDDVTFWYVNQYYLTTSVADWRTRIGSFRLGSPTIGALAGSVTDEVTGLGLAGAAVATTSYYSTATSSDGVYRINLPTGIYTVAASAEFYRPGTNAIVVVTENNTTLQHFVLSPLPLRVTPVASWMAAGPEGGPFSPYAQIYRLSNASLEQLSWTCRWDAAWLDATPMGGTLAAGAATTVTARLNYEADFLPAGLYAAALIFSNATSGEVAGRTASLRVEPRLLPVRGCYDFIAGLPAGWLIITNGEPTPMAAWRFDDPGSRGNLTGGDGAFAVVDSDLAGSTTTVDTILRSASVGVAGLDEVKLEFKTDYNDYQTEHAEVDVSRDGLAGPWTTVWSQAGSSLRGPRTEQIDLSGWIAGATGLMVRFHYYDGASWGWWWQVDDVCVRGQAAESGSLRVEPRAGWSASGYHGGPFEPNRVYRLTNSSPDALTWTARWSAAWAQVRPSSGALSAGGWAQVTVGVSAAAQAMLPGQYQDQLVVSNQTDSGSVIRALELSVLDPLAVSPTGALTSAGLEGGPFSPTGRVYQLANQGSHSLTWTASVSTAWLTLQPRSGMLDAGAATSVFVGVDASALPPTLYQGAITFSNRTSGVAVTRDAHLNVIEITGEMDLFDSVAPTNDALMPFGAVLSGGMRSETVTVWNTHGGLSVLISNVYFGYHREDFDGGTAYGFVPDEADQWAVTGGEYRAQGASTGFMTSRYGEQSWGDASASTRVRRDGSIGWAHGVAMRVSEDFDASTRGSGYLFLLSGSSFSVFWQNGSTVGALQGWSPSTAIRAGTNTLTASVEGSQLRLFVNGTLVWEGEDTRFAAGQVAVIGYSSAVSPETHYFDDVIIDLPLQPPSKPGRKQLYLNSLAEEGSRPERPQHKDGVAKSPPLPPEPPAPALLASTNTGPFNLAGLPALPLVVAPGSSFSFRVTYQPTGLGSNRTLVTVAGNDNDEPRGHVAVSGHAAAGLLTGRVTAAHSGAPLAGVSITADNGATNWVTTTDAQGRYWMRLVLGTYEVSATLANYATQTVFGVDVTSDDGVVVRNFALQGSRLSYGPSGLYETLSFGQVVTNILWITNSGPLVVDLQLPVVGCEGPLGPVSLAPSNGQFPRGSAVPALGRAPSVSAPGAPGPRPPVPHVPCFGVDMIGGNLVSFSTGDPGSFTTIGDVDPFVPSVEFLRGDFSRLFAIDGDNNQLLVFDTASGVSTVIGALTPLSGQSWAGLAGDPTDGSLYACSTDASQSHLYTVDPETGTATWIGEIRNAPGCIDIAINSVGELYGLDIINDNLLAIDKGSGGGTVIGSIGFDANYAQDMDFDELSDTLFLAAYNNSLQQGELRVADTLTGNSALVAPFEGGTEMCMAVATGGGGCEWVRVQPARLTVPPGSAVSVSVEFDVRNLVQTGVYQSAISFIGGFINKVMDIPLTVVIQPDDLVITPLDGMSVSSPRGGPLSATNQVYVLTNQGPAALTWTTRHDQAWVQVAPAAGSLPASASLAVTVSVDQAVVFFPTDLYEDRVVFHNEASGSDQRRSIKASIAPPPPLPFLCFPLDTDPGWVLEGGWAFGPPLGGGSSCGDPTSAHSGSNVYGYVLNGDYPNNMAAEHLRSAPLDCSDFDNVHLEFWRWFGAEVSVFDQAAIEVSTNGVAWQTVWAHSGGSVCDGAWVKMTYDISSVADRQPTVYLRWRMGPTDVSVSYPGWNIDDICLLGTPSDTLWITPVNGLDVRGFEGGPFAPTGMIFTLHNFDVVPLAWIATASGSWFTISSTGGLLPAGGASNVQHVVAAAADAMPPGEYGGGVVFSNALTGVTHGRASRLWVSPVNTNLHGNGSFEQPGSTAERAAYWEFDMPDMHGSFFGTAVRVNWRHFPTNEGAWSGAIRGDWSGAGSDGGFWQERPAVPGGQYMLSAWMWADDGHPFGPWTAERQGLKLEFMTGDLSGDHYLLVVTQLVTSITQTWQQITVGGIAPPGCTWVRAVIFAEGVGTAGSLSVDDVELIGRMPQLQIWPLDPWHIAGKHTGPFAPSSRLYQLLNPGPDGIYWSAHSETPWVNVSPAAGALPVGATQWVTAAIAPSMGLLATGGYTGVLIFSNLLPGLREPREVQLNITPDAPASCGVILSEYVEGSGNNKAVEIFNGDSDPLDLAAGSYILQGYHNGSQAPAYSIALTGVVPARASYVVVYQTASPALLAKANQLAAGMNFNGDDALVLRRGGTAGSPVDVFGQVGFDPGSAWGVGTNVTVDKTLRRKPTVTAGDIISNNVFDPAAEWLFYPADTFDDLGAHSMDCGLSVTVLSYHGQADPPSGTHYYEPGQVAVLRLTNTVVIDDRTQYVSAGWSGTGSAPSSGVDGATGPFFVYEPSAITWIWRTNYWLDLETAGAGVLSRTDAWLAAGSATSVTGSPAAYHFFRRWVGETNGTLMTGPRSLQIPMTQPRLIVGEFEPWRLALGTPIWWMDQMGLADEEADSDMDGHMNWQEYVADTVPTNKDSILLIWQEKGLAEMVYWWSSTGRYYTIRSWTNLGSAAAAVPGAIDLPGTGGVMTNPVALPVNGTHIIGIGVHE